MIEARSQVYLIPTLPKLYGIITELNSNDSFSAHTNPSKTVWYNYKEINLTFKEALIPTLPKLYGIITYLNEYPPHRHSYQPFQNCMV